MFRSRLSLQTSVSINSELESSQEEEEGPGSGLGLSKVAKLESALSTAAERNEKNFNDFLLNMAKAMPDSRHDCAIVFKIARLCNASSTNSSITSRPAHLVVFFTQPGKPSTTLKPDSYLKFPPVSGAGEYQGLSKANNR